MFIANVIVRKIRAPLGAQCWFAVKDFTPPVLKISL